MFGSRRLAKRSIVGTKVSALYQDGRYYTGVIQSQISEDPRQTLQLFSVKFEDGSVKSVTANNIIGQGFESVQNKNLRTGQKVYITLNGREVSGTVLVHDGVSDEVLISLEQVPGESKQILRMIDEIRLLESRKSARLSDQDTDYSKLADFNTDSKRRTVSHFIDVPSQKQRHRDRVEIDDLDDLDVEMEDESIAVAALTNLSCSPASPLFPASFNDREVLPIGSHSYRESGHLSSSVASSGFYSGLSEGNDRSPPFKTHFSESAPDRVFFEASPTDDCLDLEEDVKHFYDDDVPKDQKSKQINTEILFQCTWPKCKTITNTVNDIERHIRSAHLGRDSDDDLSDDEEDFYFTEIEINLDNVTEKFSHMMAASPPSKTNPKPLGVFDHDYQRKENRQNASTGPSSVPSSGFQVNFGASTSTPIPIKMIDGNTKRSLSWGTSQNNSPSSLSISSPIRNNRLSPQARLQQHQAQSPKSHLFSSSPKSTSVHRKPRSEVRKCRKIYGMENRDQWCTQCKWKKACSRFQD